MKRANLRIYGASREMWILEEASKDALSDRAGRGMSSPLYKSSKYVAQNVGGKKEKIILQVVFFFSYARRQNTDEGEIQGSLHRSPEAGAGERVSFQQIHHHQEEI